MVSVSGVRGIVGKTMTPEVAVRFAGAVGTWLVRRHKGERPRPRVALSWDGRWGGDSIYASAEAGLLGAGCEVKRIGVAMTPTLGVVVDRFGRGLDAGIQITASHNPQEWNGLKVLLRDGADEGSGEPTAAAPAASIAAQFIELFQRGGQVWQTSDRMSMDWADADASSYAAVHLETVVEQIMQVCKDGFFALRDRWLRVVLDSCEASGSLQTPELLDRFGVSLRMMGGMSGVFPHTPEPTEANLTRLAAEVKKHRADVGFAQDPDADRLAIIDENGRYIGEEYTLVLAALALAEFGVLGKGSVIVVNLSTSRMIEDVAAKVGASVVRTPVGEANVVEAMKKLGPEACPLGGEGNGGVIWPRVTYVRDSLSGMALVLALMAKTGKTVSQLISGVPSYAIVKRKVDLKDKSEAVRAAEAVKGLFKGARVDTQDGVRVDVDDATYGKAWLHVRASNTEPIMRLIAEASTKGQAEKLLDAAARAIG
jgi:phosphomannomutase